MGSAASVLETIECVPASIRWNSSSKPICVSDSMHIPSWLSYSEAKKMLEFLTEIGEKQRSHAVLSSGKVQPKSKYPLWAKYYGYRRQLDGARALDRWGSNYESWIRVAEPPEILAGVCKKLKKQFNLPAEALNSIVVNYYFDGTSTYIPAHRDTTTSLQDASAIYCLSLGVARDFVLCSPTDAGKHVKSDMRISHEFRVRQGDLFALGPQTNETYCHAVPQECAQPGMRISIMFRTVDKSFIDLHAPAQPVVYANNVRRIFTAECVTTTGIADSGTREHIANLISTRELQKRVQLVAEHHISADLKAGLCLAVEESSITAMYGICSSVTSLAQGFKEARTVVVESAAQGDQRRQKSVTSEAAVRYDYYMGRVSNLELN